MGEDFKKSLSWERIEEHEDYMITYLLYREGKDAPLIAKIRRIAIEQVNEDLIQAKTKLFLKKAKTKSLLDKMLEIDKSDRMALIHSMSQEEKESLAGEIHKRYDDFENPEDKMTLIWIMGELRERELIGLIHKAMDHPHGNVRRLACSALNKIGDQSSIEYLHRALMDSKPQVRQYAAKALMKLGNERSLLKLRRLLNNPKEKQYVKVAFLEAIQHIDNKMSC